LAQNKPQTDRYGDPLPEGTVARLGTVRLRHGGTVRCVAWSPDGKLLASGGWDNDVRFWDPTTGKEIRRFQGHTGPVSDLAFGPNGRTLASASNDNTIRLWDMTTGAVFQQFGYQGPAIWPRVRFSPDGRLLAVGGCDSYEGYGMWVFDLETGEDLWRLAGEWPSKDRSQPLAFSPDGKRIACINEKSVYLVDVISGIRLCEFKSQAELGRSAAFSPDGSILAWGGRDGVVQLWDVTTGAGRELCRVPARLISGGNFGGRVVPDKVAPPCITDLAFAPDGKTLTFRADDWQVWDLDSGEELRRVTGYVGAPVLSPDGKLLAGRVGDTRIALRDTATGQDLFPAEDLAGAVAGVAFAPNGKSFATAILDGTVRLWDAGTGRELRRFRPDNLWPRCVAFSPDGKMLAAGGQNVAVWRTDTGQQVRDYWGGGGVKFLAFVDDGKALVCNDDWAFLRVEWLDGKRERLDLVPAVVNPRGGDESGVAVSPDGRTVAANIRDWQGFGLVGGSSIWDVSTGKKTELALLNEGNPHALCYAPSGKLLASLDEKGTVRLWEMATGKLVRRLEGAGRLLLFSPDGLTLATGGPDHSILLLDVPTGQVRHRFSGHRGKVLAASFSPDGKRLVTSSADSTVLIWDLTRLAARRPVRHSGEALAALWRELDHSDPARAYPAVWALAASEQAPAVLLERMRSLFVVDQRQVERFIADLDSDDFETRESASQELDRLGDLAEPALRRALVANPTADVRKRLTQLLAGLEGEAAFARRRRPLRAVEALEALGTAAARRALEQIATEAPGTWLKDEVKASLRRLAARSRAVP
jgi:WD40 repeat protein